MSMYTDLIDNLEILKLDNIKNILPGYLDEMKDKNISFTEMLYDLTKEEIKYQTERAAKVNIKVSAFPFEKTLDDFDFSYQPSVDKTELYDLETLRFMEKSENIIFVGTSGVGKTHLATAILNKLTKKDMLVLMGRLIVLLDVIKDTFKDFSSKEKDIIELYSKVDMLIIDDLGTERISSWALEKLYTIIENRNENKLPIIVTTRFNKESLLDRFSQSEDEELAEAVIEKLYQFCYGIELKKYDENEKKKVSISD